MQLQNIEFLKQFRKEEIGLPFEDGKIRNVQFRYFGSSRKGKQLLEKYLENQIAHSELIGALISKMETEDQVISRRLTGYGRKILKKTSGYSDKTSERGEYLGRVCGNLDRFLQATTIYEDKAQSILVNTLRGIQAEHRADRDGIMGSKVIRRFEIMVGRYLDIVYLFHTIFADLLDEELARTGTNAAMSALEEALFKLTMLVKSQMSAIETTARRLAEWKTRSRAVEVQEVYN